MRLMIRKTWALACSRGTKVDSELLDKGDVVVRGVLAAALSLVLVKVTLMA